LNHNLQVISFYILRNYTSQDLVYTVIFL
jgi:hypothetical protein